MKYPASSTTTTTTTTHPSIQIYILGTLQEIKPGWSCV
jgi:hypothetical protein